MQELLGADGFIIVYNVQDRNSFNEVSRIVSYIHRVRQPLQEDRIPKVIAANFSDSDPFLHQVSLEEGKELAIELESPFFQTVASNPAHQGAHETFNEIVRDLYLIYKARQQGVKNAPVTNLVKMARQSKQLSFRISRMDSEDIKFGLSTGTLSGTLFSILIVTFSLKLY